MDELEGLFSRFYLAVNGYEPYSWQVRLMKYVAESGDWPNQIGAPTGAGKTAVEEVHVFLNAFAGSYGIPRNLPRRICLVVNRRSLVDSQFIHAQDISRLLADSQMHVGISKPDDDGILELVANRLSARQAIVGVDDNESSTPPLSVDSMHGGTDVPGLDRDWRSHPERVMIICSTPDMFGSRLLFRGYGISKGARPIEAGLLAYDTVLVVDEAHLNRQLVQTASRVKNIEGLSKMPLSNFPLKPLQVVESTATPPSKACAENIVGVTQDDLLLDENLARRLNSKKGIILKESSETGEKYASSIAAACQGHIGSVGVILNTVSLALKVAEALRKNSEKKCITVVGRMRPHDRDQEISSIAYCEEHDEEIFIVGTQALEVGMNYDCQTMVTELAPATSLVQRFGRVNRFGHYPDAQVIVFIPEKPIGPYSSRDLLESRAWLETLPIEGVSPNWLANNDVPGTTSKRKVFQRLERNDVEYFSHTSEDLAADEGVLGTGTRVNRADLDLWLRDDFSTDEDSDLDIVVRGGLPKDGQVALGILSRVPSLPEERLPCPIGSAKRILEMAGKTKALSRFFLSNDGTTFSCESLNAGDAEKVPDEFDPDTLRPGSLLVFDQEDARFFKENTIPPYGELSAKNEFECIHDVYESALLVRGEGKDEPCKHPFILGSHDIGLSSEAMKSALGSFCTQVLARTDDGLDPVDQELLESLAKDLEEKGCSKSYLDCIPTAEVLVVQDCPDLEESAVSLPDANRVFVICQPNLSDASSSGLEMAASKPITLASHSADVAKMASTLAEALGIDGTIKDALEEAGKRHDDGKIDSRFQEMLRGRSQVGSPLAKGRISSRVCVISARHRLGIVGWRHEQLSAAMTWSALRNSTQKNLVTRLVGTSHGYGRDSFIWSGTGLTKDEQLLDDHLVSMVELFDQGEWEHLVSVTSNEFGFWRIAFLEAIVRAADVRISAGDER